MSVHEADETAGPRDGYVITADAISKLLENSQVKVASKDQSGFPRFDPDYSRIDVGKWCDDIDSRIKRDALEDYDVIPRVQKALSGRAKLWYDKYGFQHYEWKDLRAALVHAFTSGADIISQLRDIVNIESNDFSSYTEFVMSKISQINRLPLIIPEDKIIKMVIGCISEVSLRNSLTFVMPVTIQSLIDHLSSIREKPKRKQEAPVRQQNEREYNRKTVSEQLYAQPKRFKAENNKLCFECGKGGHFKSSCPARNILKHSTTKLNSGSIEEDHKKNIQCSFCKKAGHDERTCWAKQRIESKRVNLCRDDKSFTEFTPVVVGDKLYRCLLDSGADCSLIRSDIADQLNLNRKTHPVYLQGIGEHPILVTEQMNVEVEFEDVVVDVSFLIIDKKYLHNDLLVGKEILKDGTLTMTISADGSKLHETSTTYCNKVQKFTRLNSDLSTSDLQQLNELLSKYTDKFITGFPTSFVTTGQLRIRLIKDETVYYRPYRMAQSERNTTAEIINNLKANGIVRDSQSPFASPMILVRKKNGQSRLCVDYRALNRNTVKDRYPLPRMDDQLDKLAGNKIFTSLDMASGFHQIPVEENSIEKTAFATPEGHYEYLRMPFGLANAPAVFQRAINTALGSLNGESAIVYLDDVLVASKTVEENLSKLERVIKALIKSGFSFNVEKCKFLRTTIEYLGREISADGIRPCKGKIEALIDSPTPKNVKQVRQFMGLANYFRKFISEFATKTACITALTKNDVHFGWSEECEMARQHIIEKLTSRPLLVFFNPEYATELHTDASALGYGAVLFQRVGNRLHVIAYYSQATSSYETNYHSYELETLAVVNSVKYFRHYLLGIQFLIVTDCNALKATKEKRHLLPRVARWWIYLQDFQFEIIYRKGITLAHADYLSRNIPTRKACHVTTLSDTWLHIEQLQDPEVQEIIERIKRKDNHITAQFAYKNGLLHKKVDDSFKLYVPRQCRLNLMRRFHEDNCHVGWEKTLSKMKEHFWMPAMNKNVRKFVESCLICLVAKRPSGKKQCELHPIEKEPVPFDVVHADFMGPFGDGEFRYVFILIDAFTKFIVLFPSKTLQASEAAELFNNYIMLFGAPNKLITDKGTNFTGQEFNNICVSFGINHHYIAPGASRGNGQVERYVGTVSNLLCTNINAVTDWIGYVSRVQLALNTTVNKTTGLSPLKILTGITGRTPEIGALLADLNIEPQYDDVSNIRELADKRIKENANRMKIRFDANKRTPSKLKVGQQVVYLNNQIRRSKLQAYYQGPYEIIGVLPRDRYKLKKNGSNVVVVVARDFIRPLIGNGDDKDL